MEKIKNSLFLNYERQNGKPIKLRSHNANADVGSGSVHAITEYCVPSSSDSQHNTLVSIANSLFIEARVHNMSLSPFGHSDPIKYVIAAAYLPLMMKEIKRDIAIAGKYQFSNVNFGYPLAAAAGFDLNDAITNIANYCKDYNIVAAKVNALYVPVSGLIQRWMEHRAVVFKDDDGDRYSMYLYTMQNYYELDTDPNSATVGQVLFKIWTRRHNTKIGDLLQLVGRIADKYAGDDDFASFCTEAIQAKMSRIVIDPIKSNEDSWEIPSLEMKFSLDDVLSLENACFNMPVILEGYTITGKCDWNITENPTTGILTCGHVGSKDNILPVYHSGSGEISGDYPDISTALNELTNITISDRFLFTHAKVKSLEGLTQLTRYVNSYGAIQTINGTIAVARICLGKGVYSEATPVGLKVLELTGYSTEILGTIVSYRYNVATTSVVEHVYSTRMGFLRCFSDATKWLEDNLALIGFKARIFSTVFNQITIKVYFDGGDFDYITSVTKDTLDTFFGVNAWNDIQLIGSISDDKAQGDTGTKQ